MFNSPFTQAGIAKQATKGLARNKLSFNGIVTNLEKTVSTINQVVPLYNQVKPLNSNSKTIISALKSTSKKTKDNNTKSQKKDFDPNIINVEVNNNAITHPIKEESLETANIFKTIDTPNKPFFI